MAGLSMEFELRSSLFRYLQIVNFESPLLVILRHSLNSMHFVLSLTNFSFENIKNKLFRTRKLNLMN